jgi:hypothetical protein
VWVTDSESEQFTERQQVLEIPQIFYSDDAEPAFAVTNCQYDMIGSDDGIRDDRKAARFIPLIGAVCTIVRGLAHHPMADNRRTSARTTRQPHQAPS